jgi:hypothetical protein
MAIILNVIRLVAGLGFRYGEFHGLAGDDFVGGVSEHAYGRQARNGNALGR